MNSMGFKCNICTVEFVNSMEYQKHCELHKLCNLCNQMFINSQALEFHYGTHHNQQQQGQYNFEQYRHAGQYNNHGQYNYSGEYNQQLQSYQNNRYHPYLLHQQRKKELHRSQQQQLDQQQEQHSFQQQQYQTYQQQYNINEQQSQYHHHQQMENIEGNEQQHYNQQQYQTSQQQQMDNHEGNEQNIQQQMSERKRQSYVFMYCDSCNINVRKNLWFNHCRTNSHKEKSCTVIDPRMVLINSGFQNRIKTYQYKCEETTINIDDFFSKSKDAITNMIKHAVETYAV